MKPAELKENGARPDGMKEKDETAGEMKESGLDRAVLGCPDGLYRRPVRP